MAKPAMVALALLAFAVFALYASGAPLAPSSRECYSFYFLNALVVYHSEITETLALETPGNVSLPGGFEQTMSHVIAYNAVFDKASRAYVVNVSRGGGVTAFYISKIDVCSKPFNKTLDHLVAALRDPRYSPFTGGIPEDVERRFLANPHPKVVEVVKPEYEAWLARRYNLTVNDTSALGLVATAGYFVYLEYFRYNGSAIPRSVEEAIELRSGDCDDMSRVLVSLLYHYKVPALIAYGYVYIEDFKISFPVENVTYVFINNGPHAFTMAYVPGYEWVSIDFLAGSLLLHPFIFEGYTISTDVAKEAVASYLELHRAINATQIIGVYSEEELARELRGEITVESVLSYIERLLGLKVENETTTTSPTTTPTPTQTEPTQTETTPLATSNTTTYTVETSPAGEPTRETTTPALEEQHPTHTVQLLAIAVAVAILILVLVLLATRAKRARS
jgi:transglutaminase-like putative cysteine protease